MLETIINSIVFPLELLAAIFLCTFKMNKKSFWPIRVAVAVLVSCYFMIFLSEIFNRNYRFIGMLAYLIILMIIGVLIFFIFDISVKEAFYYSFLGYAIQHFASSAYILAKIVVFGDAMGESWISSKSVLIYIMVYSFSYFMLYLAFIKKLPDEHKSAKLLESAEVFLLVIPVALILSFIEKGFDASVHMLAICQIYSMIACFLVIWIQYWQKTVVGLKMEVALQNQVISERRKQFDQSISNIDVINHKCHDLKYQIQALKSEDMSENRKKAIDEVTDAVNFYDDFFQTGNEILDTVLMEKSIICRRYNVSFTAMVDGKILGFMNPMDLYVLLGNALDNAIEAVREIPEKERRVLNVRLKSKDDLSILQIENSHNREIKFNEDGNPVTSKDNSDYHGFGVGSIRQIAEKYNGTINMHTDNEIFVLTIIFAR